MMPTVEPPTSNAGRAQSTGRLAMWISLITVLVLVGVVFGAWQLSFVSHSSPGTSQRTFEVPVDFSKFRQIMVRKQATAAIVSHGGMQLLEEKLQGINVDTSGDGRPILNALRGHSQAELAATKQLLVSLDDPSLEADQLSLTQRADIRANSMLVRSAANQPAGNLEDYSTTLAAQPAKGATQVTVSVDMRVLVKVPKLFVGRADARVQQAAEQATSEQQAAIEQFINQHAGDLIVLPELKGQSSGTSH